MLVGNPTTPPLCVQYLSKLKEVIAFIKRQNTIVLLTVLTIVTSSDLPVQLRET